MPNDEDTDLSEALRKVGLVPGQPAQVCQSIETLRQVEERSTQATFIERISHTSRVDP